MQQAGGFRRIRSILFWIHKTNNEFNEPSRKTQNSNFGSDRSSRCFSDNVCLCVRDVILKRALTDCFIVPSVHLRFLLSWEVHRSISLFFCVCVSVMLSHLSLTFGGGATPCRTLFFKSFDLSQYLSMVMLSFHLLTLLRACLKQTGSDRMSLQYFGFCVLCILSNSRFKI